MLCKACIELDNSNEAVHLCCSLVNANDGAESRILGSAYMCQGSKSTCWSLALCKCRRISQDLNKASAFAILKRLRNRPLRNSHHGLPSCAHVCRSPVCCHPAARQGDDHRSRRVSLTTGSGSSCSMASPARTTLSDHVVAKLRNYLLGYGIPASVDVSTWHAEHQERHKQVILAWYSTLVYYSRQGSAIDPVMTQESSLQDFVSLAAASNVTVAMLTAVSKHSGLDSSTRLTLHLTELLTQCPAGTQRRRFWWSMLYAGTTNFDMLIAESSTYWQQLDKTYSPTFKPVSDAVIVLRSILLIVKLISIASADQRMTADTKPKLVMFMLWQMLEKPLTHIKSWSNNAPAAMRVDSSGTVSADANTLQCCQLTAAIVQLIIPLVRTSLRYDVENVKDYCTVLKRLLLPQWGQPAVSAKCAVLKSGGLPLLLAALDKDRSAALGASEILALAVGTSSTGRSEADAKLCSSLLQMGAVERLSQLFQSAPRTNQKAIDAYEIGTGGAERDQPSAEHLRAAELYEVEAFRTAKWAVDPNDPSILYFPATTFSALHKQQTETAALMLKILESASNGEQNTTVASASQGTPDRVRLPVWPLPSSKEWTSISTVAERAIAILRRVRSHAAIIRREQPRDKEANFVSSMMLFVHAILQLLAQLLTGHVQNKQLNVKHLLEMRLLDQCLEAYTTWNLDQMKSRDVKDNLSFLEPLLASLLLRSQQECKVWASQYHIAGMRLEAPVWMKWAAHATMRQLDKTADKFASSCLAEPGLRHLVQAFTCGGMANFCLKYTNAWSAWLPKFIETTQGNCQLLAIACYGQLCKMEYQAGDNRSHPHVCCFNALQMNIFSLFLPAYRDAVQSDTVWSVKENLLPALEAVEQASVACAGLPPSLHSCLAKDCSQVVELSTELTNKLPKWAGVVGLKTAVNLLPVTNHLTEAVSTKKGLTHFRKATFRANTDLLRLCFHSSHHGGQMFSSTKYIHDPLLEAQVAALQDPAEFHYFGEQVFRLAVDWLDDVMRLHPGRGGTQNKYANNVLMLMPDAYLYMIAKYKKMGDTEAMVTMAAQACSAVLVNLYLLVHCYAAIHRRVRGHAVQKPESIRAKASSRRSSNLDTHAHNQMALLKRKIEGIVGLLTTDLAKDGALIEAIKQREPDEFSRCLEDSETQQLAQDLSYISVSRALPIATVKAVQVAFALTQTSSTQASEESGEWLETGQQLMDEEQEAADKAAAKKAKKLRQKAKKRQTQAVEMASPSCNSSHADHSDSEDDEAHHDLDVSPDSRQFSAVAVGGAAAASLPSTPPEIAAGTMAGTIAGTTAGATADSTAGSTAGNTAGTTAGSTAGATAGSTEGSTVGSPSDRNVGTSFGTAGGPVQPSTVPDSNAQQKPEQSPQETGRQVAPTGLTSGGAADDQNFLQDLFRCPITKWHWWMQAIMADCVIAADGHSYERAAITNWLQNNSTSPVTGKPLQHKRLVPNVWVRGAIEMNKDSHIAAL